ncbi:hypothetical protein [Bdellovibrio bacteriovorus]|uniref:Uncharacterized protein n=1 Tax=Bdellovibrio bacteriovorus str. Tiberius TaxID=1069642 RepID=K7ZDZ1_BDEBC|nr:hypothetical protein [Bdellovibrio bacteriovorus]AFX99976.1 hypothetical protein Bdt_0268 [Bdellovibrio bacteriovorus str. Tiberius]
MASCPSCHQPVEILDKHLGTLFTCSHCNAVFFVDWNGQPELAQHEPEPETPAESFSEPAQSFQNGTDFQGGQEFVPYTPDNSIPEQSYQDQPYSSDPQYAEQAYEPSQDPGMNAPPQDNVSYSEPVEVPGDVPPAEEAPYDFSQTLDSVNSQPMAEPAPMSSDTADFSDVTDFANADTAVGPLAYTVTIDGIESSRLVTQLREAMTDSRFGWDVTDLLSHVGGGRLVLRGLTPAKASVLINRIKYLPFKISWRQDVLSGS